MILSNRYTEYDTWAWLYNQTMGPQYRDNQLQPLETLLLPNLPERAYLLDLCCGTGHLMQPLLQRGYRVTGLDGSAAMLHYACENAPQGEFVLADARSFDLPARFDAVFSTSASLNHINSLEDLKAVFGSVYAVLKPNGTFLFDLNHPGQMQKWWRGKVAEGEIAATYAWMVTPVYDAADNAGYFQVTVFQAPQTPKFSFQHRLRQIIYWFLNLKWLTRLRLKLLSQFQSWENWQRSDIRYQVKGYTMAEVQAALGEAGFIEITTRTITGNTTIDDDHSAYFICRKPY